MVSSQVKRLRVLRRRSFGVVCSVGESSSELVSSSLDSSARLLFLPSLLAFFVVPLPFRFPECSSAEAESSTCPLFLSTFLVFLFSFCFPFATTSSDSDSSADVQRRILFPVTPRAFEYLGPVDFCVEFFNPRGGESRDDFACVPIWLASKSAVPTVPSPSVVLSAIVPGAIGSGREIALSMVI